MKMTRRRTLRILAASCAVPVGVLALRQMPSTPQPVRWQGTALGALSAATLWSNHPDRARHALVRMQAEVHRLENIFSLYRTSSEISQLNRDGGISRPSKEFLEVLDLSRRIAEVSVGAFDPTVQPLWQLYSERKDAGARDIERTVGLVDYAAISASGRRIRLGRPGMAISLNGIAQGYITDRITDLLGNEGFESAMVELGETRALGSNPDGNPFSVGLVDPLAPHRVKGSISLSGNALAVSGGYGHHFDMSSHHIFDPHTGASAMELAQVAVTAPLAALADGLSTAIYVAGAEKAPYLIAAFPNSQALLTGHDGQTVPV